MGGWDDREKERKKKKGTSEGSGRVRSMAGVRGGNWIKHFPLGGWRGRGGERSIWPKLK